MIGFTDPELLGRLPA